MNLRVLPLLSLLVFIICFKSGGQTFCPDNVDFEYGNFTNWSCFRGQNQVVAGVATFSMTACAPIATLHTITSGAGTDAYGGFPVVAPSGGSYSLKLGKDSTENNADEARYFMHIPSGSTIYSLIYKYAMVLENPPTGHTPVEMPRMVLKAYDSLTGTAIPCANYVYVSAATDPGFVEVGTTDVYYKSWTTGNMKFPGENGKTVGLDCAVGGCTLGGHFGYGYLDMSCGLFAISTVTCGATTATLVAPGAYASYSWKDSATFSISYGTTQTVTITVPTVTTTYAVICTPVSGYGCVDTLYTVLVPTNLVLNPSHDTSICRGASVTLSSGATDISLPLTYSWAPSSGLSCTTCISPVATPSVTTRYTVTVTDAGGCLKTDTIKVTVYANPVPISGPPSVCTGARTILTDTSSGGTWSSATTGVATIGTSGILAGVTSGTAVISYTIGGICVTTTTEAVNPTPPAITGTPYLCPGTSTSLYDGVSGGTWISSNVSKATVGSTTGQVTGVAAGTALVTYEISATSCFATDEVTVNPLPGLISGVSSFCAGTSSTFSDFTSGGTWSSGNTSVATVGTSGAVYGVSTGTTSITYMISTGCISAITVTINPLPTAIYGTAQVCPGFMTTLADATSGGSWSSADITVGTVGTGTGVVTGINAGTTTITYTLNSTGCSIETGFTVNPTPSPISGLTSICLGLTTTLSDVDGGGVWTSSSTSTATVGSLSGVVTGNALGLVNITYTLPTGCYNTIEATVYPNPGPISGPASVCIGSTISLTDGGGGTWGSDNVAVLEVISTLGSATGVTQGTAIVTYTLSTGCINTTTITVIPSPTIIGGPASLCVGTSVTLTDGVSGGTWTSSNITVATIGSLTGILNGVTAGTSNITYSFGGSCRVIRTETVLTSPAIITGTTTVCAGSSTTLSDGTSGGTWSSNNTSVATAGSTTGNISGVSGGTVTITYKLANSCLATTIVTVNPTPTGILGNPNVCVGGATDLTDGVGSGIWSSGSARITLGSVTGVVTGVTSGTAFVTYSIGNCRTSETVTINPLPSAVTGTMNVCAGSTTTLGDITSGGSWISGNITVAMVGSSTGIVAGLSGGTVLITYELPTGCITTATVTINPSPSSISGVTNICSGDSTVYTDLVSGGTWLSSNTSVATIGSSSGELVGVSHGTSLITYTLGFNCIATKVVTVYASPTAMGGPTALCVGATITLSDGVTSGTWVSSNTTVATIGSMSGVVSGSNLGTTLITYTAPGGCQLSETVTVSPTPSAISGQNPVCAGSTVPYTDLVSGGLWTSSDYTVANIGSTSGMLTGASVGTAVITYSLGSGCTAYKSVTVIASPAAISGGGNICVGATITLTETSSGGTWVSSAVGVGTVNTSGAVYGVGAGSAIISYVFSSGCAATTTVVVSPTPTLILGPSTLCSGTSITLTDGVSGGLWSSTNTTVAGIGSLSGIVSGSTAGTTTISYTLGGSCSATRVITVFASPTTINGLLTVCNGSTSTLSDTVGGGTWVSTNTAVATIGSVSGTFLGIVMGTSIISYTVSGGCSITTTISVSRSPDPIVGSVPFCVGSNLTLSDDVAFGNWTSSNTTVAGVGSVSGVVSGASAGTATITYSLGTGCWLTTVVTVTPTPSGIVGPGAVCVGGSINLSDPTAGGTWMSNDISSATIGSITGSVTAVAAGSAVITYTATNGCYAVKTITVNPLPGPITGNLAICAGSTTTLSDISGGTWSSNSTGVATVGLISGVVTSVSAGTDIITCGLSTGCYTTTTVTVNPMPSAISGATTMCAGATSNLGDLVSGGTWSSSDITTATVGSSTGVVTGVNTGSATITYTLPAGCMAIVNVTIKPSPLPIIGATNMCVSTSTTYTDLISGGTWTSSNLSVVTINISTGMINGILSGTSIITYALSSGCVVSKTIAVNPTATAISGPLHLCYGSCYNLTDAVSGGSWSSTDVSVATIGSSTGTVCGVTVGTSIITYLIGAGCLASATVSVAAPPLGITGTMTICQNGNTLLNDATLSGTWSSSNTSVATIGTGGLVAGVAGGTTIITYTIADGCTATAEVTVNPISGITGLSSVCQFSNITLSDLVTGGSWVSGNLSVATIDATLGVVTGVAQGSSVITYTLSTGCNATRAVTVNPVPGNILGIDNVCIGQTTSLSDPATGGTWSSSNTSVGTISSGGLVSGISAGTTMITYKLPTGCLVTTVVTVNSLPLPITGAGNICAGNSETLVEAISGGSWSATGTATIGSSTGVVTGVSAGTATIVCTLGSGCITTTTITIYPTPTAIIGTDRVCVGQTTGLSDGYPGGAWSTSSPLIASIGSGSGIITGSSSGTVIVTYALSTGCMANMPFTVVPDPSVISGGSALCVGGSVTLSDLTLGGAWSTSDSGIAIIDPVSGMATGRASGTVLISYTLGSGCMAVSSIIVNPVSPVNGPTMVCPGQSIYLSDTTEGGTWSSSNLLRATAVFAGDTLGMVTGVAAGAVTISYVLPSGCVATKNINVNPAPDPITGSTQVCVGQTVTLYDATLGGTWESSRIATAIVGLTSGMMTGMSQGTAIVSYTSGGCFSTATVTVNPLPDAIVGNPGACLGGSTLLTDATPGGTWSSSNLLIAPVGMTTGFVSGDALGSVIITYQLSTGCIATTTVTVNPVPMAISGSTNFCVGSTSLFHDPSSGGIWSSSDPTTASVDISGLVTGVNAGSASISYSMGTGCYVTRSVNILPLPPGIAGASNVCVGALDSLGDGTRGGIWISSSLPIATVGSITGIVAGVAMGNAVITYTLGSGCTVTTTITVNPLPLPIVGSDQLCVGLNTTLTDYTAGGTWSSNRPLDAPVDPTGVVTGDTAGTAVIAYTLGTGCSANVTVTVYPVPTAITGNMTVCLGSNSTLHEAVPGGSWYSTNMSIATVPLDLGVVHGDSLGTTTIIYSLGPGCSAQTTVTVVALPDSFTVTGGGNYCAGGTGVAIGLDHSTGGTNYLLYRGITATGAFSGTGFPLNFGLQTIAGIYTVVAISTSTGCTRPMDGNATVSITPTVLPAVTITMSGRDTVCAGTSVTYSAVPVHGGSSPTYEWNINGTNVGVGSAYTYIPANGDTITVTMTSNQYCASPVTGSTDVVANVQPMLRPYVNFTNTPGDTVCSGMSVTFYASPTNGGYAPLFQWIKNGSVIGSGTEFTYIPSIGDLVNCFMTSNFPCLSVDTASSPVVKMMVDTPMIPSVTINTNPGTSVGAGETITMTAMVTNGGSNPSYQWYVNGVPVPGATSMTFTKNNFDRNFEDSVSVLVTSSGVCPMTAHNWVYIEVSDLAVNHIPASFVGLNVLPNPNKGSFTLMGMLSNTSNEEISIEITDLLGQVVYSGKILAQGGKIHTLVTLPNDISNGVYILNVHSESDNQLFHIAVDH